MTYRVTAVDFVDPTPFVLYDGPSLALAEAAYNHPKIVPLCARMWLVTLDGATVVETRESWQESAACLL